MNELEEIYTGIEMTVCNWCAFTEVPPGQFFGGDEHDGASVVCETCESKIQKGELVYTIMSDARCLNRKGEDR